MLDDEERRYLLAQRVARLATVDGEGSPHVVPIVFALVDNEMYFVVDEKPKRTRTGLKRLRNIAQNPHVAVVVDEYDEDWTRLSYLMLRGTAKTVTDSAVYQRVLAELRQRYPPYRSMPLQIGTHPMVQIAIDWHHYLAR